MTPAERRDTGRHDRAKEKTVISFAQKPAQDVFMSNMKVLSMFLAGLIAIVVIAYKFASHSWDAKQARVAGTKPTELSSGSARIAEKRRRPQQPVVIPGEEWRHEW